MYKVIIFQDLFANILNRKTPKFPTGEEEVKDFFFFLTYKKAP